MERSYLPSSPGFYRRSRVEGLLHNALAKGLVSVVAGPGYGKTLETVSAIRYHPCRLVWLHLVKLDNDEQRFWERFVQAVEREVPRLGKALGEMPFPATPTHYTQVHAMLAHELARDEPMVMVADDFDCIENSAVLAFFDWLVQAEFARFTLVVISNGPLSRFGGVPAGAHARVATEELCFTLEEVKGLYAQQGVPIGDGDARRALADTGGWPMALKLMCDAGEVRARGALATGPQHRVAELFEVGYYAGYTQAMRRLLVSLSLFASFPLELVRAIGYGNVEQLAAQLAMHPFIRYDYGRQLFVFQQMYREFLAHKQPFLGKQRVADIYRQAGALFLARGCVYEAIDCFWECGDYPQFIQALRGLPRRKLSGDFTRGVLARLNSIPADFAKSIPMVDFLRGVMYANAADLNRAEALFLALLGRLRRQDTSSDENRQMLGDVYAALADVCLSKNSDKGLEYIRLADECLTEGSRLYNRELLFVGNNNLFFLPSGAPGEMARMVDYFTQYEPYANRVMGDSGQGFVWLCLAEAAYYQGQMDKARENAYQAIQRGQVAGQYDVVCNGYWMLMRVCLYYGEHQQAKAFLDELEACAGQRYESELFELRDCACCWYYVRVGDMKAAARHAEAIGPRNEVPMEAGRDQVVRAHYLMAAGREEEAYAVLSHLGGGMLQRGLWHERVVAALMRAEYHLRAGTDAGRQAVEHFSQAYRMLYHNDVRTIPAEFGKLMLRMIDTVRKLEDARFDDAWLERLYADALSFAKRNLAMTRAYARQHHIRQDNPPQMTRREAEVLHYMAQGLTREDIGKLMGISVNGVKKHAANIYLKLGAMNRADAVYIATINGLLGE